MLAEVHRVCQRASRHVVCCVGMGEIPVLSGSGKFTNEARKCEPIVQSHMRLEKIISVLNPTRILGSITNPDVSLEHFSCTPDLSIGRKTAFFGVNVMRQEAHATQWYPDSCFVEGVYDTHRGFSFALSRRVPV